MKRENAPKTTFIVAVLTLLLAGTTIYAADTSLRQATAVYGVIVGRHVTRNRLPFSWREVWASAW